MKWLFLPRFHAKNCPLQNAEKGDCPLFWDEPSASAVSPSSAHRTPVARLTIVTAPSSSLIVSSIRSSRIEGMALPFRGIRESRATAAGRDDSTPTGAAWKELAQACSECGRM